MFEDAGDYLSDLTDRTSAGYEPAKSGRLDHPKGFAPGVIHEPGKWLVTTPPMEMLGDEVAWGKAVESLGIEVPEGWRVRCVEMRYDPAAWHRDQVGEDAVTRPVWRYRFAVEENPEAGSNIDELVAAAVKAKVTRKVVGGEGTLVVCWNDWQLFKAVGDGIEGTVERIRQSFDTVIARAVELRRLGRKYPRLLVVASGDLVEGCEIFPHQAWELSGDSRDQQNAARRLIVAGLTYFARHFEQVQVLVVGGNHGERRIDGKRTNRHDNMDVQVFEQAADVLAMGDFDHVTFHVPREDLSATIEVEGWVLGTTHGHIAGKGANGPEAKLWNWFKGQAAGKKPVGDADILVTSHFHHPRLVDWGGCVWVQAGAMDGGSPQHTDLTGMDSRSSLTTFGIMPGERLRDYEVTAL